MSEVKWRLNRGHLAVPAQHLTKKKGFVDDNFHSCLAQNSISLEKKNHNCYALLSKNKSSTDNKRLGSMKEEIL